MSTHEPPADRDGRPVPSGADRPSRSVVVSGAEVAAASEAAVASEVAVASDAMAEATGTLVAEAVTAPETGADGSGGSDVAAADGAGAGSEEDSAAAGEPAGHRWTRDLLWLAAVCVAVLLVVNAFVARPFAVPSGSMEGTLQPGDRLVVNQLAYAFGGHVQRGDVVVFDGIGSFLPYAAEPAAPRRVLSGLGLAPAGDTVFVKRVIGVGGDRVTCCGSDGRLRVNGVALDESDYLFPGDTASSVPFDIVVPRGELWLMGDHRSASRDSRDHLGEPGGGTVSEDKVIGRADWVVFPVGRWTSLERPAAFAATGGTGTHGDQG
ncbi:signal peptidase I [Kitasatospora sp. NPDC048365]|uniref:signal peptidase I n=1 Tax=Kitasatospora sp. NPDC048365 TaxID=3364050 RepID=UPI00371BA16E